MSNMQHAAGTRQAITGKLPLAGTGPSSLPNSRLLICADGRRGTNDSSCFSNFSMSFTISSFQLCPQFFHSITITPGGGVGGAFQQPADFLECVLVPDFQHNDFALLARQFRQTPHCLRFFPCFIRAPLKPPRGFQLPGHPPPKASFVVQSAVPETTHTIMLRLLRGRFQLHQRRKCLMQNIF